MHNARNCTTVLHGIAGLIISRQCRTDELFTVLHKCWNQQEIVMNTDNPVDVIAEASIKAQELNAKRNRLIRALDEVLGYKEVTLTEKTYDKEK